MMARAGRIGAVLACLVLFSAAPSSAQPGAQALTRLITDGLEHPVAIVTAAAPNEAIYVVDRDGTVPELRHGGLTGDKLLDLSGSVHRTQRHRLMAIALHPDFAATQLFYAYYNDVQGDAVVGQFRASAKDTPDADSLVATIKFAQPVPTQNGGWLAFGPDKQLYISTADGGERGPDLSAASLLGKIIRISPQEAGGYKAPLDNPRNAKPGLSREVWASGFTSPEHFAFGESGKVFVLDSRGEPAGAKVSLVAAGGTPAGAPSYTAARGERLVGGAVCRGCGLPAAEGGYLLADGASGKVFSLHEDGGKLVRREVTELTKGKISAINLTDTGSILATTEKGELFELPLASAAKNAPQ